MMVFKAAVFAILEGSEIISDNLLMVLQRTLWYFGSLERLLGLIKVHLLYPPFRVFCLFVLFLFTAGASTLLTLLPKLACM